MSFISDIRQFVTPAAFAAYLATLPMPNWPDEHAPSGSTVHNTYRPTPAQWVGLASMQGMIKTYTGKGWDRGPHLYLCVGAPNPAHDGLFVMTPLGIPGVHAGDCNAHRFGLELVGDFHAMKPSQAQQGLLLSCLTLLHRWAHLGPDIVAHRDCMAGRTCPGDALYALMPSLKTRLAAALSSPQPTPAPPDPLKAEILPGPNGTRFACSIEVAGFYLARGGIGVYGYPLSSELRATGLDGRVCSYLPCERAVIKNVQPDGVHLALLSEAMKLRWI